MELKKDYASKELELTGQVSSLQQQLKEKESLISSMGSQVRVASLAHDQHSCKMLNFNWID